MARPIDITGQKFNKWTVESLAYVKGYDKYYNCVCECGTRKIVLGQNIRNGKSKSCGCEKHKQAHNFIDRTGQKYNRLTCLRYEKRKGYIYWECQCDCGNITWVRSENLTSGAVKSCGCAGDHVNRIHGKSHTRLHNIWSRLFYRCYNPKCAHYYCYGGRGIKVCEEWHGTEGFMEFQKWAMNNGYADNLSIDRIDVNGNYEPSNCRWADQTTQMNNTRANHYITYEGETHTITEWARIKGMKVTTLSQRIIKLGWPLDKAFKEEVKVGRKTDRE